METWYRTRWGESVEPVCVSKSTEKTVTLTISSHRGNDTRKALRHTSYEDYFPTWEEAHAFLVAQQEKRVADAKHALDDAPRRLGIVLAAHEKALARVRELTKPTA